MNENESLIAVNNIAQANLGDGFQVSAAWLEAGQHQTLTLNHALGNQRFGFHVWPTMPDPGMAQAVISQNVAIGNQTDLKDDNPDCHTAVWQHNTFDTASEACIHEDQEAVSVPRLHNRGGASAPSASMHGSPGEQSAALPLSVACHVLGVTFGRKFTYRVRGSSADWPPDRAGTT